MQLTQITLFPELTKNDFKQLDVPVLDGMVDKKLFTIAFAVPPKVHWRKEALLDDISPASGIGAARACIREQLKNSVRIVGHVPGRRREMLLTANSKNDKQIKRVRWYANGQMLGENKSYAWFNATGFMLEDAPTHFVFMALNGDEPFWWVIPTSKLIDAWEVIDDLGIGHIAAPDDIFRVPRKQWNNGNGFLRIRLTKTTSRYVFNNRSKVGL